MAIEITSGDVFSLEQLKNHAKVYAGPGAGKTHFLVENMKSIVTSNPKIIKSKNRKVLCVTYTNAAVEEIKNRLGTFTERIEVYTIHSFIIEHIIYPFQEDLKDIMNEDFGITVSDTGLISSQIEGLGILHGVDKNKIYDYIHKENFDEGVENNISYSKKSMGDIEIDIKAFIQSINDGIPRISKLKSSSKIDSKHTKTIKKYIWSKIRVLTHDEILYFGYRILENNPTALYSLRVKFPFIFVDEFQDTNPLQTIIFKLVGQKSTFIGVVGDIAQSIYSFQGAQPSDFINFTIDGDQKVEEYIINGNRRSTTNIINFCNFLRQSDKSVIQVSKRPYDSEEDKVKIENRKVHFLIGISKGIQNIIKDILQNNGVILTRKWVDAFRYIKDIESSQSEILKKIYNSYHYTPIKLRNEVLEHNNVSWVRAFRFIFMLWESYTRGSFIDITNALRLYVKFDLKNLTPKLIFLIKNLCSNTFSDIDEHIYTCMVIEKFNDELLKQDYDELRELIFGNTFYIPIFNEYDNEKLQINVTNLFWSTSYKLFTEVFSENSKYMTVHQAKGLEWNSVIVSVNPNTSDEITLESLYNNPQLIEEKPSDEFTRMYYVACSRAKNDLYIHFPSENVEKIKNDLNEYLSQTSMPFDYDCLEE